MGYYNNGPIPNGPLYGWKRQFSAGTLAKGAGYFTAGRVSDLQVDSQTRMARAKVKGSRAVPYSTSVMFVHRDGVLLVRGECSCPVGFNCKHVVALLLVVAERAPALIERGEGEEREVVQLSREARDWIAQLDRTGARAAVRPEGVEPLFPGVRVAEELVWMLYVSESAVMVRFGAASRNKKNPEQFNKPRQFHSMWDVLHERMMSDADMELALRAMKLLGGGAMQDWSLSVPGGSELLEKLLATGRVLLAGRWERPLKLGAPRGAKAEWFADESGGQMPVLTVEPPATKLLLLDEAWFVDEATNEMGVLKSELSSRALALWANAPVLRAGEVQLFMEAAAAPLSQLGAPLPAKVETEVLAAVPPVPVLRLFSEKRYSYSWSGRDAGFDHRAALSWAYGEVELSEKDPPAPEHRICRDGRILVIPRDGVAECAAIARLTELGFATKLLSESDDYRVPPRPFWMLKLEEDWIRFLSETAPVLRAAGWRIEKDKSFQLDVVNPDSWFADIEESGSDWFGLDLGVVVDGKKIPLLGVLREIVDGPGSRARFARVAESDEPMLVRLSTGALLSVPAEKVRLILGTLLELGDGAKLGVGMKIKVGRLRAAEIAGHAGEWEVRAPEKVAAVKRALAGGLPSAEVPEKFNCALRPYQLDGFRWLQFLRAAGLNGVLADDMGLGKTVQTIAHLLAEVESGRAKAPCLVVAPTSLMHNWRAELERFAPSLRVLVSHGLERRKQHDKLSSFDVVVTSYALLRHDSEILTAQRFHLLVLDEAQNIKNPLALVSEVCGRLEAAHRLCLTGTPLENHLGELWSLFNFLQPGFLGSQKTFTRLIRTPIEKRADTAVRDRLVRRISPLLLRRTKEQVAADLPPKTEITRAVELEGGQRDLYETIRVAMQKKVMDSLRKKGLAQSQIIVLDALLKLRQACCDPRLVKLDAAKKVKNSAKLDLLFGLLTPMLEEGRRILLFSQFTSMLALIEERLAAENIPWLKLTGETTDRATPVERFQRGEVPLFLISLKAGGTGLNLTAADTVIHYDPWWNPAVENQATDRAHRIGQDKPVFVYKLHTTGTVEEKIIALQARKAELARGILDGGDGKTLRLTEDIIADLLAPIG